jgi:hypothetical protein
VVISSRTVDPQLKELFETMEDLHRYFASFVGDAEKVAIDREKIKINKDGK